MNLSAITSKILIRLLKYFRRLLEVLGGVFLVAIILSFTDYPYYAYYYLGTHNTQQEIVPDVIVLLGGGGMPSPDGFIRSYYSAKIGNEFPAARIIIAIPPDTALHKESPELLLAKELILRGIDSTRLSFETEGNNTHSQALNVAQMLGKNSLNTIRIRIVSSPEHIFRSVATFRKAGFKEVGGIASFEEAISEKMLIDKYRNKREKEIEIQRLNLRYNMWNYLKYEIIVVREYCAIIYYKLRGWI
jgi:uncharacterized SAM-binding protein YcdF (DUF218 family)